MQPNRIELILKTTGMMALAFGVVLGFCDLMGWLTDEDKAAVAQWMLTSQMGLSVEHSGANKFMKAFPPPDSTRQHEVTHLTKHVITLENGPVQNASINYMYRDRTRSKYVATLPEVIEWSRKTWYPFLAWVLSFIGFLEVAGGFLFELWRGKKTAKIIAPPITGEKEL